jgi:hypothetical protein
LRLDGASLPGIGWGVTRKCQRILKRLEKLRGVSEEERILIARSLAATPDERWRMHEDFLHSFVLSAPPARKASGFK